MNPLWDSVTSSPSGLSTQGPMPKYTVPLTRSKFVKIPCSDEEYNASWESTQNKEAWKCLFVLNSASTKTMPFSQKEGSLFPENSTKEWGWEVNKCEVLLSWLPGNKFCPDDYTDVTLTFSMMVTKLFLSSRGENSFYSKLNSTQPVEFSSQNEQQHALRIQRMESNGCSKFSCPPPKKNVL